MTYRNVVWSGVLAVAGATMGLVLLCIAPFVAVATLAGRTLPRRLAIGAIVAMWLINQVVGFGWMHYPRDVSTFAWGGAILVAALASGFTAGRVRVTAFAFLAAFGVFELVLSAWSLATGERPAISARVVVAAFSGNLFGIAILGAIRLALLAIGTPGALGSEPRAIR